MKVHPSYLRLLLLFSASVLLCGIILFLVCISFFLSIPWGWQAYAIIAIWVVLSSIFAFFTFFRNYYEVNKRYVIVHRGFRQLIYYYNDVVYIDEEKSTRKKMIHFYTNKGHTRYITFDKNQILYKTMLSNCKNRLTKEEFERRYPKVKL
ncbi:MAG: hypothetical protein SO176_00750 [Bacilli bacterium]|nr:hypothetical protein [Bacilli bacterium]